jgi:hypothetical protein
VPLGIVIIKDVSSNSVVPLAGSKNVRANVVTLDATRFKIDAEPSLESNTAAIVVPLVVTVILACALEVFDVMRYNADPKQREAAHFLSVHPTLTRIKYARDNRSYEHFGRFSRLTCDACI